LLKLLRHHIGAIHASTLGLAALAYVAVSWVLFVLAGERALTDDPVTFFYFFMTTASTVGYGDLSPQTASGRLIAALWFFPGALLVFTAVLAKLSSVIIERARRMNDGFGDFSALSGATVIVGYHADRTERIIQDIHAGDDGDEHIIVVTRRTEVSLPSGTKLVCTDKLDSVAALRRGAVAGAAKVMVYADSDAETFNACLAVRELNTAVHVAAYFYDRDTARRAKRFARVETVGGQGPELLARAAQDPGSNEVLSLISAATENATLYSAPLLREVASDQVRQFLHMQAATLVAIQIGQQEKPLFNRWPAQLPAQTMIYYIADERLTEALWATVDH